MNCDQLFQKQYAYGRGFWPRMNTDAIDAIDAGRTLCEKRLERTWSVLVMRRAGDFQAASRQRRCK